MAVKASTAIQIGLAITVIVCGAFIYFNYQKQLNEMRSESLRLKKEVLAAEGLVSSKELKIQDLQKNRDNLSTENARLLELAEKSKSKVTQIHTKGKDTFLFIPPDEPKEIDVEAECVTNIVNLDDNTVAAESIPKVRLTFKGDDTPFYDKTFDKSITTTTVNTITAPDTPPKQPLLTRQGYDIKVGAGLTFGDPIFAASYERNFNFRLPFIQKEKSLEIEFIAFTGGKENNSGVLVLVGK